MIETLDALIGGNETTCVCVSLGEISFSPVSFISEGTHEFAGRRYCKKSKLCEEAMAFKFCGEVGGGVLPLRPPRSNRKRNDDVDEFVRLERKMNPPNAQRTLR